MKHSFFKSPFFTRVEKSQLATGPATLFQSRVLLSTGPEAEAGSALVRFILKTPKRLEMKDIATLIPQVLVPNRYKFSNATLRKLRGKNVDVSWLAYPSYDLISDKLDRMQELQEGTDTIRKENHTAKNQKILKKSKENV